LFNLYPSCGKVANPVGSDANDPFLALVQSSYRVLRGGSWNDYANFCRVSFRYGNDPYYRNSNYGFRVVSRQF
ncbi:MAG: SUMF1/EgtB/PvdO family nonheme iron enzyme, partial [Dysgonamonadaceae bacterium]|nr:SUMF1/EgtB/PvdO family nonheme iron enzyme [Dysgonamonadaceae bacterium]